jgi:anaerobic selenocysteine-containing dehydrogenase
MLLELRKASKRGAKIVSFNPLREKGLIEFVNPQSVGDMLMNRSTGISTHYYQPVNGGDQAIIQGMIKYIFEQEGKGKNILDINFINEHTSGFDAYKTFIENLSWDFLVNESGLTKDQIVEAAEIYLTSGNVIACWAMGLTQHKHAVATIQEVVNLLLLKGNIGRQGAGVCPVRGHSNVQGNRTVGIYEKPSKGFLDSLGKVFKQWQTEKQKSSLVWEGILLQPRQIHNLQNKPCVVVS